jgi:hypothetical protein
MSLLSECPCVAATLFRRACTQIRGKRKRESMSHHDNRSMLNGLQSTMAPSGPMGSDGEGGEPTSEPGFDTPGPDISGMGVNEPNESVSDTKSPTGEFGGNLGSPE